MVRIMKMRWLRINSLVLDLSPAPSPVTSGRSEQVDAANLRRLALGLITAAFAFALAIAVLVAPTVLAQPPYPPLDGVVATDSGRLDADEVNDAAKALQNQGAQVLVLFIEATIGHTFGDAEAYLDKALEHYGLAKGGIVDSTLVAIFVGTSPLSDEGPSSSRPLYIQYGDRFAPIFGRYVNKTDTVADTIRLTKIIPRLSEGDFSGAMVAGLQEAAHQIELYRTPPTATPPPPTEPPKVEITQVDTRPLADLLGQVLRWAALAAAAVLALAAIVLLGMLGRRVWVWKREQDRLRARWQAVKGDLATLLNDLASFNPKATDHDPFLPEDPADQTDMVLITGLVKDERPEVLSQLREGYRRARDAFQQASEGYRNAVHEEPKGWRVGKDQMEAIIGRYDALLAQAREAEAFTHTLTETRRQLEQEVAGAPGAVDAAKKALSEGVSRCDSLAATADLPPRSEIFARVQELFRQAEEALAAGRPLTASQHAGLVPKRTQALVAAAEQLAQAQGALATNDAALVQWEDAGFRLPRGRELQEDGASRLNEAFDLLRQGEVEGLAGLVDEALERTSRAVSAAQERVRLHQANAGRLAELEKAGQATAQLIARGAVAFDAVDEYAPSCWQDIRGNGTEAQKAANRAHELWLSASGDNRLGEDIPQDFERASAAINEAFAQLDRADTLIRAIEKRLADLKQAQATAHHQLDLVRADIATDWDFIRQPEVDRDVGIEPEKLLQEAEAQVRQAESELAKGKPDWLAIVAWAQEADRLADTALERARSEKVAMDRRRVLLASEKQEAEAALSRVSNFVRVHRDDLGRETLALLERAEQAHREALRLETATEGKEDLALAQALDAATAAFVSAETPAAEAYQAAEREFREMESLRGEVAATVSSAQSVIGEAERYIAHHSRDISQSTRSSLAEAKRAVPAYRVSSDKIRLGRVLQKAQTAESAAARAYERARRDVSAAEAERERIRRAKAEAERRRREEAERRRREEERRRREAQRAREWSSWGSSQRSSSRSGGGWGGGGRSGGGW